VNEVLTFIGAQWDPDCRRAAIGLLNLVAKDNPHIALKTLHLSTYLHLKIESLIYDHSQVQPFPSPHVWHKLNYF
jgi:hypothetical protein